MIVWQHTLPKVSQVRSGAGIRVMAMLLAAMPASVAAQAAGGGGGIPVPPGQSAAGSGRTPDLRSSRSPKDSSGKAGKDAKGPLVDWGVADSVTLDLLKRKGYNVVRYKAAVVEFASESRTIMLIGDKKELAAVERDPTQIVADTIAYTDTSTTLRAQGPKITMRDPSRGEDVVAHEWMNYDVELKQGTMRDVETAATSGQRWLVKAHRAAFATDSTATEGNVFYGRDGVITSCEDSIPHYDFVAKELDAQRLSCLRAIDVENAAANRILAHHLHRVASLVANGLEVRLDTFQREFFANAQIESEALVMRRRVHLQERGVNRCDRDGGSTGGQAEQRNGSLFANFIVRREFLSRQYIVSGQELWLADLRPAYK